VSKETRDSWFPLYLLFSHIFRVQGKRKRGRGKRKEERAVKGGGAPRTTLIVGAALSLSQQQGKKKKGKGEGKEGEYMANAGSTLLRTYHLPLSRTEKRGDRREATHPRHERCPFLAKKKRRKGEKGRSSKRRKKKRVT